MAELTISGTVRVVLDRIDTPGANGTFSKRDIVIQTDEQYPQEVAIQFTGDKCDLLDIYKVGEHVTIGFNLRGKLGGWTNPQGEVKYFTTVQGWKISRTNGHAAPQTGQTVTPAAAAPAKPGARVYVHTDTVFTEEVYLKTPGWNHDVLVANKKGHWQTPPIAPPAPVGQQTQANFPAGSYPPPSATEGPDDDLPF